MLQEKLKEIIPKKTKEFAKFEKDEPYYYDGWREDRYGECCLYYWFWNKDKTKKNQKRIVISELVQLLKVVIENDVIYITRDMFKKMCAKTESEGPCGFTVSVRLLETLGVSKYEGRNQIRVIDRKLLKRLIE